jgi:GT2 family glycosyltransferase
LKIQNLGHERIRSAQNHRMSNSSMAKSRLNKSAVLISYTRVCQERRPMVSVIILNYNGRQYLHKLFYSLNRQSLLAFEIVFVDNASSDDSVNLVKQLSKNLRNGVSVKIIKNDRNFGYCKGNNIGASVAKNETEYLVFLNNDTYVDTDWLRTLVQVAKLDNTVGAVGSRIVNVLKSSFSTIALACDSYAQTDCINVPIGYEQKPSDANLKFFYCSGASFLIPKDVFWEVGGFDEALFMYHDELDLCWRIRLYGYKVAFASSSICYHIQNPVYGLSLPVWKYYHGIVKNRLRVLLKNYSMNSLLRYFPQAVTLIALRGFLSALVNRNVYYLSAFIKGIFWNLKNLKSTLLKRNTTQQLRKVEDKEILENMIPYSLEIAYFKRLFSAYV